MGKSVGSIDNLEMGSEDEGRIEEKIRDVVGEVERERSAEKARQAAQAAATPAPEPPLELVERPPKPPPAPLPMSEAELARRWRRIFTLVSFLVALASGVAGYFGLTEKGREQLPPDVRRQVEQTTERLETAVDDARDPPFYTFTDDEGVVHIVDSLEKVPKKFRARAKKRSPSVE